MVKVKFSKIAPYPEINYEKLIDGIPAFMQEKALKYRFEEDKLRSVVGKILLKNLLIEEGYQADILNHIEIDKYQRPFLNNKIDFNISHSGDYVVCAISKNNRIGIDIEKIVPLNILDFEYVLTKDELRQLLSDPDALNQFYAIWTKKEAVMKANGKGLEIEFTGVLLNDDTAICENIEWKLVQLDINNNYKSYLATQKDAEINISELTIDHLIQ